MVGVDPRAGSARAVRGLVAWGFVALLLPPVARAQNAPVSDSSADSARPLAAAPAPAATGAPLIVHGDTVLSFVATVAGVPPERRAALAKDRLESVRLEKMVEPVRLEPLQGGYMVLLGDSF